MHSQSKTAVSELAFARHWLVDRAIPFFANEVIDRNGFAYEELTFDGEPRETGYRRTMVQFRQVYVFSHAAKLGLLAPEPAVRLFDRMTQVAWHPECGWVHSLSSTGRPLDTTRDAYDQAFAILASAWVYALTKDQSTLAWAYRTLAFMNERMLGKAHGYVEALPERLPRRQNPHMHLFEALLALYEVSGDVSVLKQAEVLGALARERFVAKAGGLQEFFDHDFEPLDSASGQIVEPGHHFEWVWLLHEYARLSGTLPASSARQLFEFANTHGLGWRGLPLEQLSLEGRPLKSSIKLWAATEQLKALIARDELEPARYRQPILATCNTIFDAFLNMHVAPVWYERLSDEGRGDEGRMPVSTLYHLALSLFEFLRWGGVLPRALAGC